MGSDGRTALMLGAANLIGPVGGFAANIVYARTLGPSGRGDLAAVVAALAVCEAALVFGFPDVLTRHIARHTITQASLRRAFAVGLLGSLVPAGLMVWWALERGFGPAAACVAAGVVPVATVAALGRGVLAGRRAFRRLVGVLIAGGAARLLAPCILLLAHRDDPDLALALIAGSTFIASIPVLLARPFTIGDCEQGQPFGAVAREAFTLWPATLAWSLNSRLDQLALAFLVAPAQLGIYAVCVTVAELPVVLAAGLRQVVLVRIAEQGGAGAVIKATHYVTVGGVASAGLTLLIGGQLMGAIFGPDYESTRAVLAALVLASAFVIASGLVNSTLIARGLGRLTVASQSTGLVLSVSLLFIVVPLGGGIVGAALVGVATYAGVYGVALVLARRSVSHLDTGGFAP